MPMARRASSPATTKVDPKREELRQRNPGTAKALDMHDAGLIKIGKPKGSRAKVPTEIRQALLEGGRLAGLDIAVTKYIDEHMDAFHEANPDATRDETRAERRRVQRVVQGTVHGDLVDYFRHMALEKPAAFMATLSKVIPKQIDLNMQLTSREVLDEMTSRRGNLEELRDTALKAVKGVDYHASS